MNTYKLFLQDLVALLKEKLEQAKKDPIGNDDFAKGVRMGLYEALDLIKSQAILFGISLEELGIKDFTLEEYL
ncbi:hypothetical protein [Leptospira alexanderi]|uniref:hypothetical protein n=1 Tax=Leptospira alexanderi TaxID=100053 RepID=UPI002014A99C|nr:hypothetical protein [Leptospira alexanderi]